MAVFRSNQRRTMRRRLNTVAVVLSALFVFMPAAESQPRERPMTRSTWDAIQEASALYRIDPNFLAAVIGAESGFNPLALSPKGAMGMMQLMPQTAWNLGVQNPFDARQNILAGSAYLKSLLIRYKNNAPLALAAYNAGSRAVDRYRSVPPYAETIGYINEIRYLYQTHQLHELQRRASGDGSPIPPSSLGSHLDTAAPQHSETEHKTEQYRER
jgi:soluble lytic murein transglycosylase-like protein